MPPPVVLVSPAQPNRPFPSGDPMCRLPSTVFPQAICVFEFWGGGELCKGQRGERHPAPIPKTMTSKKEEMWQTWRPQMLQVQKGSHLHLQTRIGFLGSVPLPWTSSLTSLSCLVCEEEKHFQLCRSSRALKLVMYFRPRVPRLLTSPGEGYGWASVRWAWRLVGLKGWNLCSNPI